MKPSLTLDFHPADVLPLGELTLLWREVYANYPVPLPFTEDELNRFIVMSGIDLRQSQVAVLDDVPIGLALAGVNGREAWIGGFGVVNAHRRSGVGLALMRHQCRVLDGANIAHIRLETMTAEPSRKLYGQAGFVDRRSLYSFNSPALGSGADPLVIVQPEALPDLHRRLHTGTSAATWQRDLPNVMRAVERDRLTILGWRGGTSINAYAVEQSSGGVSRLIDVAAESHHAAEAMIMSLASRVRGRRLCLNDEPADSPIANTLKRFGAAPRTQKAEMMRVCLPERAYVAEARREPVPC